MFTRLPLTYSSFGNKHLNVKMSGENYIEPYLLLTGRRREKGQDSETSNPGRNILAYGSNVMLLGSKIIG
jgi:hypothetical protein